MSNWHRRPVDQLFEAQVGRCPEAIAIDAKGEQVTYKELNRRANQLARHLRSLGAGPGECAGICFERSADMIIGVLGVIKAGMAYVPLDPTYPEERLALMIEDARLRVLLTQEEFLDRLPPSINDIINLDAERGAIGKQSGEDLVIGNDPDSIAYVIYTSGSTGRPKGIAIPHKGITRLVSNTNYIQLGPSDTVAQLSNSSFDAATFEVFGALLRGARLVMMMTDELLSPHNFASRIKDEGITTMFLTTALFNFISQQAPAAFGPVKHLLFGGEQVDPKWPREVLRNGPPTNLLHVYGPTENTTFSTWHRIGGVPEGASTIPIGQPVSNTEAYVLDCTFHPVPAGVPGELYVAGAGLARGYLNRPELTAERFLPNPFSSAGGKRLYKTGDLVSRLPEGAIEFIGRLDDQVKIRGYRIEPGEVESVLKQHAMVRDAAVIVREVAPGDKRLAAYVAGEPEMSPSAEAIRDFMKQKLPDYMIPATFVILDRLPLTVNGKVDRAALHASNSAGISPQNGLVASRNQELPSDAAARKRKLFEYLLEEQEGIDLSKTKITPAAEPEAIPLSFAQQRLWFLDQLQPGSPTYNIPGAFRIRGPLNVAALRQSIHEVVRRHEALRTTFVVVSGRLAQVISSVVALAPSLIDPGDLPDTQREAAIQGFITEEDGRGFDLQHGPLLRVGLIRLAADEYVLALTMHHIVSDGWSLRVFIREIRLLYEAFASGRPSPLPSLPIQYRDFSIWQREYLAGDGLESQQAYWRQQLGGELPLLSLPSDHTRPAVQSLRGATLSRMLSRELSQALRTLTGDRAATLFMTLVSAFNVLMHRYSGQRDLIVGTPVANRNRTEIEGLIGLFVNTLVLRADLSGDPAFSSLLDHIKEVVLGATANQDMPFDLLVGTLQQDRDMSHMPLFQVMFSLNDAVPRLKMAGLTLDPMPVGSKTAKFDLTLFMEEADAGLSASFEYNSDLFEAATVERMLGHFETLLRGIADDPACRISDLPLLTGAERAELTTLPADRVIYPATGDIPAAFELQVAQAEDMQIYVLDECLGLLPFGAVGEVYVAGRVLSGGDQNRPELAAERFVPDPFSTQKGERLLKTGDLARVRASREVEYLGRASDQVKFRGHRIELSDIESVLNRHHNVRESKVAAPEDQTGRRHLTAYIISAGGGELSTDDLQRQLADELPKYMIPERFVILESWPLTEDGKPDRAALAALRVPAVEAAAGYVEPQTEIEKKIAAIWRELLEVGKIGLNDNFFDLGGNSLLMARACGELRTALDRDISVIDMFRHPSVGALARYLSQPQLERPLLGKIRRRTQTRKTLTRQRGQRGLGGLWVEREGM